MGLENIFRILDLEGKDALILLSEMDWKKKSHFLVVFFVYWMTKRVYYPRQKPLPLSRCDVHGELDYSYYSVHSCGKDITLYHLMFDFSRMIKTHKKFG